MTWTQFLTLDGGYPDGVWKCAGCPARLGDNDLEGSAFAHADDCTEMATIRRPATGAACSSDDLAQIAYAERCRFLLGSGIVPATWEQLQPGTRRMLALEAGAVAAAERDRIRELSVKVNATYLKWIKGGPECEQWTFADLLKEDS